MSALQLAERVSSRVSATITPLLEDTAKRSDAALAEARAAGAAVAALTTVVEGLRV